MRYRCPECGEVFENPIYEEVCLEDYNGVSSLFGSRHYATFTYCPECREPVDTEYDIYYEEDDE